MFKIKVWISFNNLINLSSKPNLKLFFFSVPANEFELSYTELNDGSVNVTCEAQGLFPNPNLKLFLRSSNGSPPQHITDIKSQSRQKASGAYDAYLYRTFSANELTKNGASVFECLLELPGTNYVKAKRIAYYPGKMIIIFFLYLWYNNVFNFYPLVSVIFNYRLIINLLNI